MQLPRGTFRSIQKGVNFSEILAEMGSSRFTGMCTLSSAVLNGTLVFRSGVCVLAKIQDQYGDKGWATLIAVPDLVTDLALSDFNTAQIQLALDFNKKARVTLSTPSQPKPVIPAPAPVRPSHEQAKQPLHVKREQKKREAVKQSAVVGEAVPAPAIHEEKPVVQEIVPEPGKREEIGKEIRKEGPEPVSEKSRGSAEESELDMFDSMDLDDVAHKIRKDCKIILKQLQLDHLTEK